MKNGKKLLENCKALGSLTLQKDVLEIKIKALRDKLQQEMIIGDSIDFESDNQLFNLVYRIEDKAVLKPNIEIVKILGKDNFIEVAKVSKTEVEKSFGQALVAKCVDHFETSEKLVLSKKKA